MELLLCCLLVFCPCRLSTSTTWSVASIWLGHVLIAVLTCLHMRQSIYEGSQDTPII